MHEGAAVEVGVYLNRRQGNVPQKASISKGIHGRYPIVSLISACASGDVMMMEAFPV